MNDISAIRTAAGWCTGLFTALLLLTPQLAWSLTGGPDGGGYHYIDSDEVNGPVYSWIDISLTGTDTGVSDDGELTVAIPFTFEFYGTVYADVSIGSNGAIVMDSSDPGLSYSNYCLPASNGSGGDAMIMPLWDDLNPSDAGADSVYYESFGVSPDQYMVIQWENIPRYGSNEYYTFQVILYEQDSVIRLSVRDRDDGWELQQRFGRNGWRPAGQLRWPGVLLQHRFDPVRRPGGGVLSHLRRRRRRRLHHL